MRKDSKDLTEIFSVGSNDSDPSIGEIQKKIKNKNSNNVTTYIVVAHIITNKIKLLDRTLSKAEIKFIKSNFCK